MNKLIIVAGASGAGKSFLLEHLYARDKTIEPIKKLSTRSRRLYEKKDNMFVDLHFNITEEYIRECEYHYKYENESYGVQKEDIDYVLERGNTPIIVVRNSRVVRQLKKDYPSSFAIYLQNILSGNDLKETLIKLGRTDITLKERSLRVENDFYEYCNNLDAYDYILLNKFDPRTFIEQYEGILEQEKNKKNPASILTFITDNEYEKKYNIISDILDKNNFKNYNLIKFTELLTGPVVTQTIQKKLENSYFTIIDIDDNSSCQLFYQGYLTSLKNQFTTVINKNNNVIATSGIETNYYNNDEEFIDLIEEKMSEYLEKSSSKKQTEIMPIEYQHMENTIEIASQSVHEDERIHPYVGALLVDENHNTILKTCRGGDNGNGEHAEYRLLNELKEILKTQNLDLSKCTLYVTLEPCTKRGKGKIPCATRVIESGIGNVVVGMLDPDINIRSRGVQQLRNEGIFKNEFPRYFEDKIRLLNNDWIRQMEKDAELYEK